MIHMKLKPYKPKPTIKQLALVLFCVALTLRLALAAINLVTGLSVVGKVTLPLLNFAVLLPVPFLIKGKRALLYVITGVLLVVNSFLLLMGNDGAEYYFHSPQKTGTVVIREKSALVSSGWADIYSLEYGIFKKKLDVQVGTDDNYQPFAHGQYRIEWLDETTMQLEYYNGHGYQKLEIHL